MKKMLLATAHLQTLQDVLNRRLPVQNKPAAVAPRETITHHFFVSGIGQRKLSVRPKFVAAQKMFVKANQQSIRKWIARFYYFRHLYSAGSACVLLTINAAVCPSIWATLSALLINILLGSFQLFLHGDQPL